MSWQTRAGSAGTEWDERTWALASERVTIGLDPREERELAERVDEDALFELELAAASLSLAELDELALPPASLQRKLSATALDSARALSERAEPAPDRGALLAPLAFAGWLAAALAALISLRAQAPNQPSLDVAYERLASNSTSSLQLEWVPTEDPLASGVRGGLVWSADEQQGYMRFEWLAANAPSEAQYQLWIFDQSRPDWEQRPVDGGVFDVEAGREAFVAIDPKLRVDSPVLFAVTLERPGGVVVSERERLLLTASP